MSVCHRLYVCIDVRVSQYVCLSVRIDVHLSQSVCLSVLMSIFLNLYVCVDVYLSQSVCRLCSCLSVSVCRSFYVCLYTADSLDI